MISVRTINPDAHLKFLQARSSASFLQTPAWAKVKPEWVAESVGWFDADELVGVALVLHRQLPKLKRSLAYLPEGPLIDWDTDDLAAWLNPLAEHLHGNGAFAVRIGPPVITERWTTTQIKDGIADPQITRLTQVAPAERTVTGARVVSQLRELGWREQGTEDGFAAGQPRHNFAIPLVTDDGTPLTEAQVLAGMNQLWRRNIKKADKSRVVITSTAATDSTEPAEALAAFHELYVLTAERDGFTPRGREYFEVMYAALSAEDPERIKIWLAHHEDDLVAATIAIRVGTHAWYSYGASSTAKREVRGSNAIQRAMIRDALTAGAHVYDLRGITETLDTEDPHVGLIQFKVGTGGEAVAYVGEWDLPLNRLLYKAFQTYLARRR